MNELLIPFDDVQWEILLTEIQARRVIPIIGPELLRVTDPETGSEMTLDEYLARQLAAKLGIANDPLVVKEPSLAAVFLRCRRNLRVLTQSYTLLYNLVQGLTFDPPEVLKKLAAIDSFDLFVSTTFDNMMAKAIDAVRVSNKHKTQSISFDAQGVVDLEHTKNELEGPVVFHLLGQAVAGPRYAITDEDILEWITKLQSNNYSPPKLSFELKHNHLLFLGLGYENWLTRFFIRTIKGRRLSDSREIGEVIADLHTPKDEELCSFLASVSDQTQIYEGGAIAFVNELHTRWEKARLQDAAAASKLVVAKAGDVQRFLPPDREMPKQAVFISYAHEDVEAVKVLKAAFDSAGIPAWFDLQKLESGANFRLNIEANIDICSYFIPVISTTTVTRVEGYFHREWKRALHRFEGMSPTAIFIRPIIIDDTEHIHPGIQKYFPGLTVSRFPGGLPDQAFINSFSELLTPKL